MCLQIGIQCILLGNSELKLFLIEKEELIILNLTIHNPLQAHTVPSVLCCIPCRRSAAALQSCTLQHGQASRQPVRAEFCIAILETRGQQLSSGTHSRPALSVILLLLLIQWVAGLGICDFLEI